jgi:hypothetical protein
LRGKYHYQSPKTPSPWWSHSTLHWHGYGKLAITLAVASLEWSGRGQGARVFFNYVNRWRNIIFSKLIEFILLCYTVLTSIAAETMRLQPPHALPWRNLFLFTPSVALACFWLVVVLICHLAAN